VLFHRFCVLCCAVAWHRKMVQYIRLQKTFLLRGSQKLSCPQLQGNSGGGWRQALTPDLSEPWLPVGHSSSIVHPISCPTISHSHLCLQTHRKELLSLVLPRLHFSVPPWLHLDFDVGQAKRTENVQSSVSLSRVLEDCPRQATHSGRRGHQHLVISSLV
jgi:hypothetical protein